MANGDGVTLEAPPEVPPEATASEAPEQFAVTVPGTQTIVSPSLKQNRGGTIYWESIDVKRPGIPQSKFAAVRAALAGYGPRYRLLISNSMPLNMATHTPTASRWRQRLSPALTDAQVTTYLAAIETAITT